MFRNTRHVHLVAVGGIGMSGIAEILLNLGFKVSGSDLADSDSVHRLQRLGASVQVGHAAEQVHGADVVVYSSAVTPANPEIQEARRLGIPVIRRAEMLAELMRLKTGVAVAGSHGKTTTTSLVAEVLAAGGLDPTVLVGGRALATGANAVLGGGDILVAEADESDGTFLRLVPTIAVVTNMDHEHVDFYPEMDDVRAAFLAFLLQVPFYGSCVLCSDDPEVRALIPGLDRKVVTYGLGEEAQVRGVPDDDGAAVFVDGHPVGRLRLRLPGRHNLANALAAVAVGLETGVPFACAAEALAGFRGVGRRYEDRGIHAGVQVIDDYGHHPTEIAATLEVARASGKRVVTLFQPHRYSRTLRFRDEFADALLAADRVALLPVYAASESPLDGADSESVAAALEAKGQGAVPVLHDDAALADWLAAEVGPGDLLLLLGAGDIGRRVGPVCAVLDEREDG